MRVINPIAWRPYLASWTPFRQTPTTSCMLSMSTVGSPLTSTRSAFRPTLTIPRSESLQRRAVTEVADLNASIGGNPHRLTYNHISWCKERPNFVPLSPTAVSVPLWSHVSVHLIAERAQKALTTNRHLQLLKPSPARRHTRHAPILSRSSSTSTWIRRLALPNGGQGALDYPFPLP